MVTTWENRTIATVKINMLRGDIAVQHDWHDCGQNEPHSYQHCGAREARKDQPQKKKERSIHQGRQAQDWLTKTRGCR